MTHLNQTGGHGAYFLRILKLQIFTNLLYLW